MLKQKQLVKASFVKKIFVKICRLLGYEIIDQSNFYVPTQEKNLSENLSIQGNKSIVIPLGSTKVTRKVNALTVIFRSCTSVNMLTQKKQRLFEKEKSEYTFRSLNSVIVSLKNAKINFPNIKLELIVVDHNSKNVDLAQIKKQLNKSNIKFSVFNLDVSQFISNIKKTNSKNEQVTDNQISNMCNIYKSLLFAKNQCEDLVYFVEDDYVHSRETFTEMIFSYERISSQIKKELILCPADYPYLYMKADATNIFLGSKSHWRKVNETLCTFLTSKIIIDTYWPKFTSMCTFEHYPFEQPLHDIYKSELCLSPIPSLALHLTNINSIFGLSPNIDIKKMWEDNENY